MLTRDDRTCLVWDLDGTLTVPGRAVAVPGVDAVLRAWAAAGVPLAVATAASTAVARAVVDELGWAGLFGHVAGSGPGVAGKEEVVAEALLGLGRPVPDGAPGAVLIGDSPGDVRAALHHGLHVVGVAWGAAPGHALRAAGADLVVDRPDELWPATPGPGDPRPGP